MEKDKRSYNKIILNDTKVQISYKDHTTIELERFDIRDYSKEFCSSNFYINLLWRLAVGVKLNQPMLIEGHTGVGKNFTIRFLADIVGIDLITFQNCKNADIYFDKAFENALEKGVWLVIDDYNIEESFVSEKCAQKIDKGVLGMNNNFRLFATMVPPKNKYLDRKVLSPHIISSWNYQNVNEPSMEEETLFIEYLAGLHSDSDIIVDLTTK